MTLRVAPVDPNHIQQVWPRVVDFIKSAVDKGTTEDTRNYNEHHIQQYLVSGQWLLLVAVDEQNDIHGACTVSFINYPLLRYRVLVEKLLLNCGVVMALSHALHL